MGLESRERLPQRFLMTLLPRYVIFHYYNSYTYSFTEEEYHLKPFRNSGWTYFSLMEEIKPPAGARGTNAFSATQATPAPPLGNVTPTEEEQHEHVAGQLASAIVSGVGLVMDLGEGSSTGGNKSGNMYDVNDMDVDHPDGASESASGKRKHAAVSVDDQAIPIPVQFAQNNSGGSRLGTTKEEVADLIFIVILSITISSDIFISAEEAAETCFVGSHLIQEDEEEVRA
jgi:hypothetical protein